LLASFAPSDWLEATTARSTEELRIMVSRQPSTAQHRSSQPSQKITHQRLPTILFTVLEVWALIVVLADSRPNGVLRIALAFVLATVVVAVVDAWRRPRGDRRTED
jgi:hypothetical protein